MDGAMPQLVLLHIWAREVVSANFAHGPPLFCGSPHAVDCAPLIHSSSDVS